MNLAESCDMVVDLTRQLQDARRELAGHRLVARVAIQHAAAQQVEMVKVRSQLSRLREENRILCGRARPTGKRSAA